MILYFSGTGNSRYAAELISMVVGDELVSLNKLIKTRSKKTVKSEKPLVFVAPIYAGRIPKVVDAHIREMKFEGNKNVYFVLVCAAAPWFAATYIEKLCAAKEFNLLGVNSVVMPQSYILNSDILSDAENQKIIDAATPKIKEIAETIKGGRPLSKEEQARAFMSKVLNPMMYSMMINAKGFYVANACNGCGKCVERCPLNNVKMASGKPQWGKECTHCMACIDGCPNKAIEYGKKTQGRNRYYNTITPQL